MSLPTSCPTKGFLNYGWVSENVDRLSPWLLRRTALHFDLLGKHDEIHRTEKHEKAKV